jgi:hypothetical protein
VQFNHDTPSVPLITGAVPYGELTGYTAVSAENGVPYTATDTNGDVLGTVANSQITIDYDYTFALAGDCSIPAGQPGAVQLFQIRDLVPTPSTGLSNNSGLNGSAAIRLVNLSPTAGSVKLVTTSIGGVAQNTPYATVSPVTNVTFGSASQYGTLAVNTYGLAIENTSTNAAITTQITLNSLPLQTNVAYSIFLVGSANSTAQPYNVIVLPDAP